MASLGDAVFVLVHGGQQGPWIWDLVIDELARRGCRAIAPEMPAGDATAGASQYAGGIARAATEMGENLIIVGHSMAGLVIPLVPQLRPVSRLVFLSAAYPEPGRSHMDVKQQEAGENVGSGPSDAWKQPGDFHMLPREQAREFFFHDCQPEVQEWALDRLRPQARTPLREITPLVHWPEVPCTFYATTEDRCIPLDSQQRTIQRLFGTRPLLLPGGHCAALSHPREVAEALATAAAPDT